MHVYTNLNSVNDENELLVRGLYWDLQNIIKFAAKITKYSETRDNRSIKDVMIPTVFPLSDAYIALQNMIHTKFIMKH